MKRLSFLVGTWFALCVPATVLDAQTPIDTLRARIDLVTGRVVLLEDSVKLLNKVVGTEKFFSAQFPCWELEAHRPPTWFPSGEYDVWFRQRQLGCGTNDLARHVDIADSVIMSFSTRMPPSNRTVTEFVASSIAAARVSPIFTGGIRVKGDIVADMGRFCSFFAENGEAKLGTVVRTCKTGAQVQTYGEGAQIDFCANIDTKYGGGVSPFKPHCGRLGVAPEGGLRLGYNEPFNNPWPDTSREWAYAGYDSAGRWCYYKSMPGVAHDNTQDFCIDIEEASKTVWLSTWRPLWKVGVINSTGLITLDKRLIIGPIQ